MHLPTLNPAAQTQTDALSVLIRQEILKAGGFISFARFMELVLYAPDLGYYSAGQHQFGKGGDFVTAPEISPLFAQCVARQCRDILHGLGQRTMLEIGAGTGVFAKDLLLELEALHCLPDAYFIFEISPALREKQKAFLATHCPHLLSRIHWLDALPPNGVEGVIIANEVMDAIPVHCFKITKSGIQERCVTWDNDHFTWQLTTPTDNILTQRVTVLMEEYALPEGYESEINLMLPAWINSIASSLNKGVILLFDYGYSRAEYYHPERQRGTLMCYYQHHRHDDPFQHVGLQDITAHVDFTTVVENACETGCTLSGYTTQALFLLHCGLLELASKESASSVSQFNQAQAIKKLTLPSQMGELIKVIALSKNHDKPLCGFQGLDKRL